MYQQSYGNQERALAQAIVDEMVARGIGVGGSSGSDGSTAVQEINTALGTKDDNTATYLVGGYNNPASWSLVSLLRGLFSRFDQLLNGYGTFRTVSDAYRASFEDRSGTVDNPNVSFQVQNSSLSRRYLLIQNHGKFNNATGQYEGDLWINIGSSLFNPDFPDAANIGAGSFRLFPGATFSAENNTIPFGYIFLLGTIAGIQYTIKEIQ